MTDEIGNILLAVHVLGAVLWVGGMMFALYVLRPSLTLLPPAQRLSLLSEVFRRFFRLVWHAMPLVLLTGYAMVFGVYGGFALVGPPVHVMHAIGLVMTVIFVVVFFRPWAAMKAALAAGDTPGAAAAAERVRKLVLANLVLGIVAIICAAFG